jgi:citrate synthase
MERARRIVAHVQPAEAAAKMSLSVTDNRTGETYEVPIAESVEESHPGVVVASKFKKLRVYDPGFTNTSSCKSTICFIDGDKGKLSYRGIPIEELAEKSTYLETSFLLLYGSLPSSEQLSNFTARVTQHTYLHNDMLQFMSAFRYDAHPMGMVMSTVAALGTFYPEQNSSLVPIGADVYKTASGGTEIRNKQIYRVLGKVITIAANAYRHRIGKPFNEPVNHLSYTENFLYMMDRLSENNYTPNPRLAKILDVLFILHADHELNCSTAAMRHLTSSGVDVYSCLAGATGALYGPLHGGACEAVLRMLDSIGSVENIPQFIEDVKNRKKKLMGFGHRVYKNYDPRARIVRQMAEETFTILGREPMIDIAIALEKVALSDPYFIERKLYPNVDFYSGLIYKTMGFPTDFFPVLFMIPRCSGWLSHWQELQDDPELKIIRPRQHYLGHMVSPYVPMSERKAADINTAASRSSASTRGAGGRAQVSDN